MTHLDPDARIRLPRAAVLRYLAEPRLVRVSERVVMRVLELVPGVSLGILLVDGEPVQVIEGAEA